jgi:hypothetical protein
MGPHVALPRAAHCNSFAMPPWLGGHNASTRGTRHTPAEV